MQDSLLYAGSQPLPKRPSKLRPAAVGAAAAANTYIELDVCDAEEARLPSSRVLAIERTGAPLTVVLSTFQESRNGFNWIIRSAWDLGADALPTTPAESKKYWSRVHDKIQEFPRAVTQRPITHVMLMGDSALDKTFLDVMRDALRDVLPHDLVSWVLSPETEFIDPTFSAARGVAEFAKRFIEAPERGVERA